MKYLSYSRGQLCVCMQQMFARLGLIERFQIKQEALKNFIAEAQRNYKRVPYHNFTHAFNIVHMCYILLRTTRLRTFLEDIDVLALMVGALGHDLDHSGMNNLYYSKTKHALSQAVSDSSILENYHAYMLFFLLGKEENQILANLTTPELARFRKATVEAILGTDMSKHFSICSAFEGVVRKIKEDKYDRASTDDRDVSASIYQRFSSF
jgi:3'5'-cyclic nucleotide phosphodiesterase